MKKNIRNNVVFLLFFTSALIVIFISVMSVYLMNRSSYIVGEMSKQKMIALGQAASLLTSADELDNYMLPADMEKKEYIDLKKKLIEFNDRAEIEFTYFLRLDTGTNQMQFVIDNTAENYTSLSEEQVPREPVPDIALSGTAAAVEIGTYSKGWPGFLTAFAPVYYADGQLSNYVAGVDMQDMFIKDISKNNMIMAGILVASIMIVLVICFACLLLYKRKVTLSESASISKSSFLSTMSHEMRTPMNAILGMAEIARGSDEMEKIKQCIGKIHNAADHLLNIINDILDISKIESGKFTLLNSHFYIEDIIKRVSVVVNFKICEKKQRFSVNIGNDVPIAIIADRQRLTQVITNLISNSLKFTPENGSINVFVSCASKDSNNCVLQFDVADTGIGIPPEKQKKLFVSFEQADNTISRRFGGTGLGLAISKNIVEMMGGRIWIKSEEGKGSTFSFTIKAQIANLAPKSVVANEINLENVKILFAGSSKEDCECFKKIAAEQNIPAYTAFSLQEAAVLINSENKFTITFIDKELIMENSADIAVYNAVKAASEAVFVYCFTEEWITIESRLKNLGISHSLSKPMLRSEVIDTLNEILANGKTNVIYDECESEEGIFKGKTVLLAEDVEINREILISLLEPTGIVIEYVENGRDAVDAFVKEPNKYELILMDIQMPLMDGYEATKSIRALENVDNSKTIPIVAMTANVFREDIEKCMESGMNDHVGKPIQIEEVIEKLKKYLQ